MKHTALYVSDLIDIPKKSFCSLGRTPEFCDPLFVFVLTAINNPDRFIESRLAWVFCTVKTDGAVSPQDARQRC